jgi:hypothetical protein
MNAKRVLWTTCLIVAICLPLAAQNAASANTPDAHEDAAPARAYRLNFSINELEEGRKVNSRQYSLNLNAGDADEVKIGTRVPVALKQGDVQYMDVGTHIWCRLKEADNGVVLNVRSEISNFATPDQPHTLNNIPLLRQFVINGSTVALPGKTVIVGSVDDPASKRTFQLEVTAMPLK